MKSQTTRRTFLRSSIAAGAGLLVLRNSRLAFGYQENDKLNIAVIAAGGRGGGNARSVSSETASCTSMEGSTVDRTTGAARSGYWVFFVAVMLIPFV